MASWDGDVTGKSFLELLTNASLAITIAPRDGQRYQGIVPLEHDTLGACLEDYFERSEQLKTRIWLAEGDEKAAGLLIQFMPYSSEVKKDEEELSEDWNRVTLLADTLTKEEHLGIAPEKLLHRLFHEEDIHLMASEPVRFYCPCSRERFAESLVTVPREELEEILQERGKIETQCQFCNETYHFDEVDIQALFNPNSQQGPSQIH